MLCLGSRRTLRRPASAGAGIELLPGTGCSTLAVSCWSLGLSCHGVAVWGCRVMALLWCPAAFQANLWRWAAVISLPPARALQCGLPYHVGGVIPEESSLLVASAAKFNNWFNVDVKESTEVRA